MIFIKHLTIATRKLAKKLWLLLLIAVDCAILAYLLATALLPTLYGAEAQVLVVGSATAVEDYARIATSRAVCNQLITDFELTSTAEQVANSIRLERLGDSSCLSIRVLCHDPKTSQILTDALARYASDMITQLYEDTVTLTYSEPVLPTDPSGATPLVITLIAFAAVLLLGAIICCVPVLGGYLLIDKKSTEELLGIPVLATIPGEKSKNGGVRT